MFRIDSADSEVVFVVVPFSRLFELSVEAEKKPQGRNNYERNENVFNSSNVINSVEFLVSLIRIFKTDQVINCD